MGSQPARSPGRRPIAVARTAWTSRTRRRTHRTAPGSSTFGRSCSLAASCVPASAAATTASTSAREPVNPATKRSGSRLRLVWAFGHYHRAIRHPCRGLAGSPRAWRWGCFRPTPHRRRPPPLRSRWGITPGWIGRWIAELRGRRHVPFGVELRTDDGPQYTGAGCAALVATWKPAAHPRPGGAADRERGRRAGHPDVDLDFDGGASDS